MGAKSSWELRSEWKPTATEQTEIDRFLALYAKEYGTDVKAVDKEGETLLHKAVAKWDVAVVKYLVFKGASVNAKAKFGWTPLHEAAERGNSEIVEFLVSEGANFNAKLDDDGTTSPSNGIFSPRSKNFYYGATPLKMAERTGNTWVATYLKSVGARSEGR